MADAEEASGLALRLAELVSVELMFDGTVKSPAEDPSAIPATIAEARAVAKSRPLTTLEHSYLGNVLNHAAWESRHEAEANLKQQAFVAHVRIQAGSDFGCA